MNEQGNAAIQESVLFECMVTITAEDNKRFYREFSGITPLTVILLFSLPLAAGLCFYMGEYYRYLSVFFGTCWLLALIGLTRAWFTEPKKQIAKNIKNRLLPIEHTLIFSENSWMHISKSEFAEGKAVFAYEYISEIRETKHSLYLVRVDNFVHDLPKNQLASDQIDYLHGFFTHKFSAKFKSKQ